MMKRMVLGKYIIVMEINIKDFLKMIKKMEKEFLIIITNQNLLEIL